MTVYYQIFDITVVLIYRAVSSVLILYESSRWDNTQGIPARDDTVGIVTSAVRFSRYFEYAGKLGTEPIRTDPLMSGVWGLLKQSPKLEFMLQHRRSHRKTDDMQHQTD